VVIEAVSRQIPGVVGLPDSVVQDSFREGLLDYPHYTRPREVEGLSVPEILLSGDHGAVDAWRRERALEATRRKRPDLVETGSEDRPGARRSEDWSEDWTGNWKNEGGIALLSTTIWDENGGSHARESSGIMRLLAVRRVSLGNEEAKMNSLQAIESAYMRSDMPEFRAGDTVKVHVKVSEGEKERIQIFQGVVIARRGSGTRESFTVRKISGGIGVERVFPLHSPIVDKIEVVRRGRVRRAKLYYLRELRGKAARIEERRDDRLRGAKGGGEQKA